MLLTTEEYGLAEIVADHLARTGRSLSGDDMARVDRDWESSFDWRPAGLEGAVA